MMNPQGVAEVTEHAIGHNITGRSAHKVMRPRELLRNSFNPQKLPLRQPLYDCDKTPDSCLIQDRSPKILKPLIKSGYGVAEQICYAVLMLRWCCRPNHNGSNRLAGKPE